MVPKGSPGTTRRRLLIAAGGIGGAAAAAYLLRDHLGGPDTAVFTDLSAVRAIGEAHLRQNGEPANFSELRALLEGDEAAVAQALRQRIRGDFAAGRIAIVSHWRLAQTEADLCALVVKGL